MSSLYNEDALLIFLLLSLVCWDCRLYVTQHPPILCDSGARTQGFIHARQGLYQTSYPPALSTSCTAACLISSGTSQPLPKLVWKLKPKRNSPSCLTSHPKANILCPVCEGLVSVTNLGSLPLPKSKHLLDQESGRKDMRGTHTYACIHHVSQKELHRAQVACVLLISFVLWAVCRAL